MALLAIIPNHDPKFWVEPLQAAVGGREIRTWPVTGDRTEIRYSVVWHPPAGELKTFPNMEVIFSLGAGIDHVASDPDLPDVPLVRFVDPNLTMRMTEYVVLHTLMHHRRQREYFKLQTNKLWQELGEPAAEELRVGVMGLGVLGRDAAEKLAALGYQVAGWSRSLKKIPGITCYAGENGLGEFLARTDILVVLLPLTDDTSGMINGDVLSGLARDGAGQGPVLINAGRGGLQVETDILAALENGRLHAATLDVFETEPLPKESPLWHHPRVTITPHNASVSDPRAIGRYITAQIDRYEQGLPLENVVDLKRGY